MEKLTRKEAFSLGVDAYYKRSSMEKYTAEDRVEGLRNYLADLAKDFKRNKLDIYEIIEDTVNEVLPKRVEEQVKQFAEYKTFGDNVQVKYIAKNPKKIKAVEVALGGHVERQRIDKGYFTIEAEAIQAKVYEEYERIIGGQVDWSELVNLVIDAITEGILIKVHQTLISIMSKLPTANKHSAPNMEKSELDRIINTIKAYGQPVIMGTPRALATIQLDTYASEADKLDIRNKGYLGIYKGCAVVELQNSFEDASNTKKVFDDAYVFILPSSNEKIVKVALQGGIKTKDSEGADWTYNFEAYQKVGVGILAVNNIGMYEITDLH